MKGAKMKKPIFQIHFDDQSGDQWWYDFDDHTYLTNLVNLKNCLFRNTLPERWITKIVSNNKIYQSDKDITNFLNGTI
jgi:hypothetical protein|tara:strand:- start:194 stop:427 length:234 start_codon:yes stop_codon:yes gene_type:complete